ncbi:hypothetical protein Nepgr_002672 [Nepenthes gracilis]|uniref:Uncharacterized protein n=1 Tax=Nepenthes gracilis TaxID=150966 RepID=A0AAD3P936_NEPGR|nr:hypothetical protein Nepgr_002672 [Nepenthes gracilis]
MDEINCPVLMSLQIRHADLARCLLADLASWSHLDPLAHVVYLFEAGRGDLLSKLPADSELLTALLDGHAFSLDAGLQLLVPTSSANYTSALESWARAVAFNLDLCGMTYAMLLMRTAVFVLPAPAAMLNSQQCCPSYCSDSGHFFLLLDESAGVDLGSRWLLAAIKCGWCWCWRNSATFLPSSACCVEIISFEVLSGAKQLNPATAKARSTFNNSCGRVHYQGLTQGQQLLPTGNNQQGATTKTTDLPRHHSIAAPSPQDKPSATIRQEKGNHLGSWHCSQQTANSGTKIMKQSSYDYNNEIESQPKPTQCTNSNKRIAADNGQ